jgi:GxxExxY protein
MERALDSSTQRAPNAQSFRREHLDQTSRLVIAAAIDVHSKLGPGLLESVYRTCTAHYLREHHQKVATEVSVPVIYRNVTLKPGLRIDMLVNDCVIADES